jgi:hypothetical protein
MTDLDVDQLVIKRRGALDFTTVGRTTAHFTDLLNKYLQGEAGEYVLRIDMSSTQEKRVRQHHFQSIGIPQWMWGCLLGYILFIRDKVNVHNLNDLLVHSGKIYSLMFFYFIVNFFLTFS